MSVFTMEWIVKRVDYFESGLLLELGGIGISCLFGSDAVAKQNTVIVADRLKICIKLRR